MGERDSAFTAAIIVVCWPLWKSAWGIPKTLEINLYDPSLPISTLPNGLNTYSTDTCSFMVIAALITVTRELKQPKYPPIDEWMVKMWSMYTMEYHSTLEKNEIDYELAGQWMELESISNEVTQTRKTLPSPSLRV